MRRRDFITLLSGAAAWPLAARAQQSAMPVIGYLGLALPDAARMTALRQGLNEFGYVEGRNFAIEFRSAEGRYDRLPALAADLARRRVSVIVTPGTTAAALAAKAATADIPIVFGVGGDPIKLGLVVSLAHPGGNATGVNFFVSELAPKRLGLLLELLSGASRAAALVNPTNPTADAIEKDLEEAALAVGRQVTFFKASTNQEIDAAFAAMVREGMDALLVAPDPFFNNRRVKLATLSARNAIPAIYSAREYVEAGGLMSYGTSFSDMLQRVGSYVGRILKGEKPSDLPVWQSTKFELVLNLSTATALGLNVPPMLLARADEVIE
jgi:putative tryptophan/tyrosine transport system substrate-binding protein